MADIPVYTDPLVPDPGYPLDNSGQNLARDYIAPITIPYLLEGPNGTTEYVPTTVGVTHRGGPSPVSEYSGLPGYVGRLDLASGLVSEYYTGVTRSWYEWEQYKYWTTVLRLTDLCYARDLTSDLINLPGIKPYFRDTWYNYVPQQRQLDPRVWF